MATMATEEFLTLLEPRQTDGFVETEYIRDLTTRSLAAIKAGFPIHFRGVSGSGKTTLAMHVASKVGRPVVLLHGDEELNTSELIGGEQGYRFRRVVDRFIHSVLKIEEDFVKQWVDNRLTIACKHGFTLIYDEFNRSRPEANNILLSILQEKILELPMMGGQEHHLEVHPDFTAIFTSNPEDYAGVFKTQDALRDRMITFDLDDFDRATEVAIAQARSGLPHLAVERIVDLVQGFRQSHEYDLAPTVRACIMIAKVTRVRGADVAASDAVFRQTCADVLISETSRLGVRGKRAKVDELLARLIDKHCAATQQASQAGNGRAT